MQPEISQYIAGQRLAPDVSARPAGHKGDLQDDGIGGTPPLNKEYCSMAIIPIHVRMYTYGFWRKAKSPLLSRCGAIQDVRIMSPSDEGSLSRELTGPISRSDGDFLGNFV